MKRIVAVGKFIKGRMYKVIDLSAYRSKNLKYHAAAEANISQRTNEQKPKGRNQE